MMEARIWMLNRMIGTHRSMPQSRIVGVLRGKVALTNRDVLSLDLVVNIGRERCNE